MLLDLSYQSDCLKAEVYLKKLIKNQSKVEMVKISPKRTSNQNRYLHAILTLYGGHFGLTTEEAKTSVKRILGYKYQKNGEWFLEHTSEMDTKRLTEFIDRFRNHSAHEGFYLPTSLEFSENYVKMMTEVRFIESQMKRYGS